MAEPDLIQEQRQLLRSFNPAVAVRIQAANEAAALLKKTQTSAEIALQQTRQRADELYAEFQQVYNKARGFIEQENPQVLNEVRANPTDQDIQQCIRKAREVLKGVEKQEPYKGPPTGLSSKEWMIIIIAVSIMLILIQTIYYLFVSSIFLGILAIAVPAGLLSLWWRRAVQDHASELRDSLQTLVQAATDALSWHERALEQARKTHEHQLSEADTRYRQTMETIERTFQQQLAEKSLACAELNRRVNDFSPQWSDSIWQRRLLTSMTPVTRLGDMYVGVQQEQLSLPAFLAFPGNQGLLLKATGPAKDTAVQAIQSLLLRLLAGVPPGKLRFTFLDPVGLGHNVAAFMHLADYDDALVTSKAWTEPQHIEQRLADLTEHMEIVIQKYLRNQFATIEDYNAQAGEVAEPYRVLVVFDFPANFSETAARRLVSIAQNGPRCGVFTVVLVDTAQPLPHGFNLADLERGATVIAWDGSRFVWQDPDFKDCQLTLDTPPDAELFDRILKTVGEAAKGASKVEVPFERIAPLPAAWWSSDSRTGLRAALGPSGARKVQYLELGSGTAQHVLVAGKTGSGKSTLLHTLITNLALGYSPDEIELYLIDFKKGVEFKTYAAHHLPHARVIAIESEREFGLSVLQGLDAELKRRGDAFRAAGVDSLADYRQRTGARLPRVLLLVDEFQEFFAEDDAVASAAAQVLDRLVRQGRAFGIHILLGSQTLAGAYSLARSTIDQMAVRIALQCSEADSRLILADDNPAARLLSRPGEAIYNAANGTVEGNNRF